MNALKSLLAGEDAVVAPYVCDGLPAKLPALLSSTMMSSLCPMM